MIRLGLVGYGYWGPRVARNFNSVPDCQLVAICDSSPELQRRAEQAFPGIQTTSDPCELITSPTIDAIAVVTPVWTHFDLARAAIANGKHVFVEKPFTSTVEQAEQLIELAARKNVKIMVDHTFLFTGAVKKLRQLVDEGALGKLYYYDSTRVNLGLFQHDVNVIWDLAPHDLSIMDYLIKDKPVTVIATGEKHLNGHEDVAYITIYCAGGMIAHLNVNWLSPVKVRTTLLGGEKKMVVWNDLEPDEKVKVYDRGVNITNGQNVHDLLISYRSGDMWSPKVDQEEALSAEAKHFIRCIQNDERPLNDGEAGLRVVRLLEASDRSLRERGAPVTL
jgi:predicted dehydrogenase